MNYLEVVDITLDHLDLVEEFCKKCNDLDWVNNATPEAMHFEDTIQEPDGDEDDFHIKCAKRVRAAI